VTSKRLEERIDAEEDDPRVALVGAFVESREAGLDLPEGTESDGLSPTARPARPSASSCSPSTS
jgi:hypothetical protein